MEYVVSEQSEAFISIVKMFLFRSPFSLYWDSKCACVCRCFAIAEQLNCCVYLTFLWLNPFIWLIKIIYHICSYSLSPVRCNRCNEKGIQFENARENITFSSISINALRTCNIWRKSRNKNRAQMNGKQKTKEKVCINVAYFHLSCWLARIETCWLS